MKKLTLILGILLFPIWVSAADVAVKDMTESTSPATTDILYLVADPGGSPLDRKVTVGNLMQILTSVNSASGSPSAITAAQARAGIFILNTYAGTTTFTLPSAAAGMAVCVRNGQGNSQVLRIDTDGTDYIVKSDGARTSGAGDYYGATADDKNQICVVAFDTTDWYVTSEVGTWTEE